jgi:hypothetical protein
MNVAASPVTDNLSLHVQRVLNCSTGLPYNPEGRKGSEHISQPNDTTEVAPSTRQTQFCNDRSIHPADFHAPAVPPRSRQLVFLLFVSI